MRDFAADMKDFETGKYPGISQVYLSVFFADYNNDKCTKRYILKHVAVDPSLVQRYLDFMVKERYIYRYEDNTYSTLAYEYGMSKASKFADDFNIKGADKDIAMSLLTEIARRQTEPIDVFGDIKKFLDKFKGFFQIKDPSDVVEVLRIINQTFTNVSYKTLSASGIRNTIKSRKEAEHSVVRETANEVTRTAQRTARFVRQYLRQNPQFLKNGKAERRLVKEFLDAHWSKFPEEYVPFELVESELQNLPVNPITLGE